MKNLVSFLIFICIAVYTAVLVYDKFISDDSAFFEKTYTYPDQITVRNDEGSAIQITLLGRSADYIEFERKDGSQFAYPIKSLNEKSILLVMKYPETDIKNMSSHLSNGSIKLDDAYTMQLTEEIHRIEAKIERLDVKAGATQSQTELRTLERKKESLYEEIAVLKSKIAERR